MKNRLLTAGLSCFLLVASNFSAHAQSTGNTSQPWGSWFIWTVQLPGIPDKKWGGFAEVQMRTHNLFRSYFYHELKAGLSYDVIKDFTVTLAGGRYSTSDYKTLKEGPLNLEKRLWEQLVMNQYVGPVRFEHRYRVEQHWLPTATTAPGSGTGSATV